MSQIGDYLPHEAISREGIASTVIATIENNQTISKDFDVIDGKIPIIEEIKKV